MDDLADGIVFVHGGKHDSRYWRPTMDVITERAPTVQLEAVDLPGRQGVPGDMSLAGCVESAVEQINATGMNSMILVGHSLAGVVVPGIATQLGQQRVRKIVAVACCVPPEGKATADTVGVPTRLVARLLEHISMPRWLAAKYYATG